MRQWLVVLVLSACNGDTADDADKDTTPPVDGDADTDADSDTDVPPVDADEDGFAEAEDCDDQAADVFPGAPDICGDDRVTDCDRTSDDGLVTVDSGSTFADLQLALDGATAGSEVRVCAGIYPGTFVAPVAVNLLSHVGAELTILDAGGGGSTLSVPADTTVTGLTIRGGRAAGSGGGVLQTSPGVLQVTDCVVRDNESVLGGGIAIAADSTATISGSTIAANVAAGGGGISVATGSTVDLTTSIVQSNEAQHGGGVFLENAALVGGQILDNTGTGDTLDSGFPAGGGGLSGFGVTEATAVEIAGNSGPVGAGFAVGSGAMVLTDVFVHDNISPFGLGGGGLVFEADLVLAGSTEISANTAGYEGGGVYVLEGSLTGGVIVANTAVTGGGVVLNAGDLSGTTVEGNIASSYGGGVSVTFGGGIDNSEIIGNTASADGGGLNLAGPSFALVHLEAVLIADNRAVRGGGLNLTTATVDVVGSSVLRNSADQGGGAIVDAFGSTLTSDASDWGNDADDNTPDDVLAGSSVVGYGADETFVCTTSCDPLP